MVKLFHKNTLGTEKHRTEGRVSGALEGRAGEASGGIPRQYNDNVCYIGGRFADVPFIIILCNLI